MGGVVHYIYRVGLSLNSNYEEKRNFPRMRLDCDAQFTLSDSGESFTSHVINLSGGGVLFVAEHEHVPGTEFRMCVSSDGAMRRTLQAQIRVIRASAHAQGGFEIAAEILKLLDEA